MRLSDVAHLRSATQEEISFTCTQLTATARSQLLGIRSTYISAFSYFEKEAFHSRFFSYVFYRSGTFLAHVAKIFFSFWGFWMVQFYHVHFNLNFIEIQSIHL